MNDSSPPKRPTGVPSAFDVFESLKSVPGIRSVQTNVPDPALTPIASADEADDDWPEQIVVVFDVDGVIAPIGGPTAWGDDIAIGPAEDGLVFSPAMCAEIDKLHRSHGAHCYWLTDWTTRMRHDREVLPGRDWPVIAESQDGRVRAQEWAGDWWNALPWWKWWALDEWLTHHPDVRRLVWVDDHQRNYRAPADPEISPARRAWTIEAALRGGALIDALLLAPDKQTGLRPLDLRIINDWILGIR